MRVSEGRSSFAARGSIRASERQGMGGHQESLITAIGASVRAVLSWFGLMARRQSVAMARPANTSPAHAGTTAADPTARYPVESASRRGTHLSGCPRVPRGCPNQALRCKLGPFGAARGAELIDYRRDPGSAHDPGSPVPAAFVVPLVLLHLADNSLLVTPSSLQVTRPTLPNVPSRGAGDGHDTLLPIHPSTPLPTNHHHEPPRRLPLLRRRRPRPLRGRHADRR